MYMLNASCYMYIYVGNQHHKPVLYKTSEKHIRWTFEDNFPYFSIQMYVMISPHKNICCGYRNDSKFSDR